MPPLQPPDLPQPVATGPSGPPEAPPASQGRPLKVLYLFSGVAHKLDMATCLQQLAATWALDLRTECVDIKRSAKQDLSLPKVRDSYLDRIRAKEFDAILLSPPCASFSRATWANFRGPRPVRSYELPRGLEKLTPVERDRAILGNIFADFSFEIATLVAEGAATFLAMEQPEDLGALPTGPHEGLRPASMWQWPQLADLLEKGLRTVAFHQASFGVPYAKPTRLLLCTSLDMPDFVYEGLPSYDDQGYYKGPLPSAQGFGKMFQRQAKGAFKTTGSEQWPVAMCQWLSAMLLSSCLLPAKDAVGEGGAAAPDDKLQDSFLKCPPGNRYTSVCCVLCWRPLVIRTVSSSDRRRMGYPWASWIRYRGLPTSSRNSSMGGLASVGSQLRLGRRAPGVR